MTFTPDDRVQVKQGFIVSTEFGGQRGVVLKDRPSDLEPTDFVTLVRLDSGHQHWFNNYEIEREPKP